MANKKIAGITVEIGGDTTKLGKALSDVDKKSKNLKTELQEINKALKLDPKNTELLAQKQQVLADAIKTSKEKLDKLKEAQEQITQQFKRGEIDEGQYRAFKREVESAKEQLDYYEREAGEAKNQTDKLNTSVKESKTDFKNTGESIEKAGNAVSAFGDKMTAAGEKATAASLVIAAAAAASYKAWEETDEGYDTIVKKTGATGDALDELKKVADNVYTSLPVEMGKVGTAIGEINTRFGSTGDQLEELTTKFIKYSEINDSDVNTSIDNISGAMKAFGLDASSAGDVLDKLTSIGQRTGLSVTQLESTLISQSATFKEMGLSIGEAAELLGQFEINGVDTATAISSLKTAQKKAASGGKTLSDELQKNISDIKNAKSETEALQIASSLFGSKGAAAMTQAIRENRVALGELDGSMESSAGTVDKTFEGTISAPDKLKVAMNQVKLEASDLAALAMEKLAPALQKVTDKIKELTSKFNALDDSTKETILKVAGVVALAGPLLIVIGKVTSGIGGIVTQAGKLIGLLATNPAALAVAGIAAVVAALAVLYLKNEEFRDFVNEEAKEIKEFFEEIAQECKEWYDDNKPLIDDMIKVLKFLGEVLVKYLMKSIRDTVAGFKLAWTRIKATWQVSTAWFKYIWDTIKGIFSVVKNVLSGDFGDAWEEIKKIFSPSRAKEFFGQVFDSIKDSFVGLGSFFKSKFGNAWSMITGVFNKASKYFGGVFTDIKNAFKELPDALADIFRKALKKVKEIAGEIGDTVSSVVDKIPGVSTLKSGVSKLKGLFAEGGTLSQNGDAAIVGEAGPELLQLLNGKAVVTPLTNTPKSEVATDSAQIAPQRTVVHQTYNIYVKEFASPQDARTTSQELAKLQRQTDFGKGLA